MNTPFCIGAFCAALILQPLSTLMAGEGSDDGRTMSFNSTVNVVPAPGPVVIDGNTDDWDLSAGVWSYNDPSIVQKFSVWTHMMWDAKGIYFLARFADKTPMMNATMGKDHANSWKADSYQARVIFDDHTPDEHQMHITMFYSTPDKKPYMIIHHGGLSDNKTDATSPRRPDLQERFGEDMEKAGGSIAIVPAEGGYNMEAFWPWSYLRLSGKPLSPGDSFVFGIEALWGDPNGLRGNQRLADGIKDEKVNRIFMFRARNGWGSAVIKDKGQLAISKEQRELQALRLKRFVNYDTAGSIPIAYELPEDRDVTIAIDNDQGVRVRNLFGQYPRQAGKVTDFWDGLDDNGKTVSPGNYTAVVLDHKPISLRFSNSLYNAATPPWPTESGRKCWGPDYIGSTCGPTSVAIRGDAIICTFNGVEAGMGISRCGPDGVIQWCNVADGCDVCMDDTFVYSMNANHVLRRFTATSGQLVPFEDDNHSPEVTIRTPGRSNDSTLAFAGGKLFAFMAGDKLYRVNPKTGAVESSFAVANLRAVTSRNDSLVGLFGDGTVAAISPDGVRGQTILQAKGLTNPIRIAIATDGRIGVTDKDTNQVFIFGADGKPERILGTARPGGERPAGKFVETDLSIPLGLAFDKEGRLWVAENNPRCKRVTVWSNKGELEKSFWGAADYGAMAGFPFTYDSTRFVASGIEFKLDPKPDIFTRPTAEKPLIYHPDLADEERGVIYQINGRDYACGVPGYNKPHGMTIFRRNERNVFVPCVSLQGGQAWVDRNGDGKRDADELTEFRSGGSYWSNGWVRPDMAIMTISGLLVKPTGYSAAGVPLYDFSHPEKIPNWIVFKDHPSQGGTPIIDMAGNVSDGINYQTADGRRGTYPNRYGRHDAPAAQRGVLIAPFRTNGVVEDVPNVGSITALSGDRGEWFLFSLDGLFISSICQDIKGDVTLDETFIGGESFGGFIWRDEKKRVMVQLGGNSYRLMEVLGLDTCRKQQLKLAVTDQQIAEGGKRTKEKQVTSSGEPSELTVATVASLPADAAPPEGGLNEPLIAGAITFRVQEPGNASRWWRASLAQDGKSLAMMFQVADNSPWKNGEGRYTHAFMGGDCVDLQLEVPGRGPVRLLVANLGGKDTAAYFQKTSPHSQGAITYVAGGGRETIDEARVITNAVIRHNTGISGYSVLITVPLSELGIVPATIGATRGIVGVIFSDPLGTNRAARVYWFDKNTSMVNDVPTEARMLPSRWGKIQFTK